MTAVLTVNSLQESQRWRRRRRRQRRKSDRIITHGDFTFSLARSGNILSALINLIRQIIIIYGPTTGRSATIPLTFDCQSPSQRMNDLFSCRSNALHQSICTCQVSCRPFQLIAPR